MTTTFPTVTGSNLNGEDYKLPDDLTNPLNVLIVVFERWQQNVVNTRGPLPRKISDQ